MATTKPASLAQLCSCCAEPLENDDYSNRQLVNDAVSKFLTSVEQGCLVCCGLFRQLAKEAQKVLLDDPSSPRIFIYAERLSRPSVVRAVPWNADSEIAEEVVLFYLDMRSAVTFAGEYQLNVCVMDPQEWLAYSEAVARAAPESEEVRAETFFRQKPNFPRIRLSPLAQDMDARREEVEFPPGSITSWSTNSDETFRKIRFWLDECDKHESCHEQSQQQKIAHWLPTRLVKVAAARGNPSGVAGIECRIVDTKSENLAEDLGYATLSHRWMQDSRRVAKLSTDNIGLWRKRIPLEHLSQTYRDAFQIAHRLGVSYVWIDSLCIIQEGADARTDWDVEARTMHRVYSNAKFNMGAACGEAQDGMFAERDPANLAMAQLQRDVSAQQETLLHDEDANLHGEHKERLHGQRPKQYFLLSEVSPAELWDTAVGRSPLRSRGWIFQEQLLSRANIYFSAAEVVFECREIRASESLGTTQDYAEGYRSWPGMQHTMKAFLPSTIHQDATTAISPMDRLNGLYEGWNSVVWLYSARDITKSEDRLVAIAGVAQYFKHHILHGDVFIAGLWRSRLAIELMWHLAPGAAKPAWEGLSSHWAKPSRCFSFSWACAEAQATLFPQAHMGCEHTTFAQATCIKYLDQTESLEDSAAREEEPFNQDIFSLQPSPPSIQLRVTGWLRRVSFVMSSTASEPALETPLDDFVNEKDLRLILGRHSSMPEKYLPLNGRTWLDIDITLRDLIALNEDGRLFTMHTMCRRACRTDPQVGVYLLVLVLVDPDKGRYRRIGFHDAVMAD